MTDPQEGGRRPESSRRGELDLLRVLVVVGLIFFHSALVFSPTDDYYVKNGGTSDVVNMVAGLAVVWAMPLLFVIAGTGVWYSLRSRTTVQFVRERLRRLFVPLVFGTLVLCPIPQWFRSQAGSGTDESYPAFLGRFLDVRLDPGQFPFVIQGEPPDPVFETGHLWFVVLLLVFSLLFLPFFLWLRGPAGQNAAGRLAVALHRPGTTLLPALPLAVLATSLEMEEGFALWNRWSYALLFLYGFVVASDPRFMQSLQRDAVKAVVVGLATFVTAFGLFAVIGETGDPLVDYDPASLAFRFFFGASGWLWLVAILGLPGRPGKAPASSPVPVTHRGLRGWLGGYAKEAVLPLYILHQPVIVAIAFYVVRWDLASPAKYLVISLGALVATVAIYDLAVRRTRPTRFLFGMKPAPVDVGAGRPVLPASPERPVPA